MPYASFLYNELFLDNQFGFNFIHSIKRILPTVNVVFNIKFHWNLLRSFADKNIIILCTEHMNRKLS